MERCIVCGAALGYDEIGLSKKLINRGAAQFKCLACLAAYYQLSEHRLRQLAAQYRAQGCTLFD
jgi:hypothetical protein